MLPGPSPTFHPQKSEKGREFWPRQRLNEPGHGEHEVEYEAQVCKKWWKHADILSSAPQPTLLSLILDFSNFGDLTSWIFLGNNPFLLEMLQIALVQFSFLCLQNFKNHSIKKWKDEEKIHWFCLRNTTKYWVFMHNKFMVKINSKVKQWMHDENKQQSQTMVSTSKE